MHERKPKETQPNGTPSVERIGDTEIKFINDAIWQEEYLKDNYPKAITSLTDLRNRVSEIGVSKEVVAEIEANLAWAEYRQDDVLKAEDNRSWMSARQGLGLLTDPETNHETRARLYEVAGLCQAYRVNEKDEPADALLRASVEEAKLSGNPSRIGESTNGFALWYVAKNRFEDAIPLFEEAAKIHEETIQILKQEGKTEEARLRGMFAGHPYNNLTRCYTRVGRHQDAIESADKALGHYNDDRSPHSFAARFRKTEALRGLGKQTRQRRYFDEALTIYQQHKVWRSEELEELLRQEEKQENPIRLKQRQIADEDRNIEATRQEMQSIFGS